MNYLAALKKAKMMNSQKISTLWVSFTVLDAYLHKMALLNILGQLSELGINPTLVAVRSKNAYRVKEPCIRIISIPIRSVPLISPIMFAIALVFFLPAYLIASKTDFVIFDPGVHILGALPALLVSKFRKVKFVLDIRTTPVELVGFQGFLHRFWFSLSVLIAKKSFDGITIITSSMKKEVCDNFDLNPDKVGVWTSGVSDTLFNPENLSLEREDLRENLGLSGKFVVFYRHPRKEIEHRFGIGLELPR